MNTPNLNLYDSIIHNYSSNLSVGTLLTSLAELPRFSKAKNIAHVGLLSASPTANVRLARKYTAYSFSLAVRVRHHFRSLLHSAGSIFLMVLVICWLVTAYFHAAAYQSHLADALCKVCIFPVSQ